LPRAQGCIRTARIISGIKPSKRARGYWTVCADGGSSSSASVTWRRDGHHNSQADPGTIQTLTHSMESEGPWPGSYWQNIWFSSYL